MSAPAPIEDPTRMELPPPKPTLLRRVALRLEQARALRGWIEQARARSATLDATLETIERDSEIGGGMLAGALSYRLFVFALPLAFFVVSGLGLLAATVGKDPHVVSSSIGLAGVVTTQVSSTAKGASSWWVALTSFFALLYATRILFRAVAIVHSLAWQRSAASVKVRTRPFAFFAAALLGQLALVVAVGAAGHRSATGGAVVALASLLGLAGLWLVVSLQAPHSDARWTELIPGALFYAIGFAGVLVFNAVMLGTMIQSKTSTYGALGTAATLLLAFFLLGRVMVGAAVLNATLHDRRTRRAEGVPPAGAIRQ